jgi:hypothetical protein
MPDTSTVHRKLCKFRGLDMTNIDIIKTRNGFHEDMTAIRFALNLAATTGVTLEVEKPFKKSRKKA